MGHSDRTRFALSAGVLTTVVVLAASLLLPGPIWLWAAIMIGANGIAVLTGIRLAHGREQAQLRKVMAEQRTQKSEPAAASEGPRDHDRPAQPEHVQYPVSAVPLPSSEMDYRFLFSATICYRQTGKTAGVPHASPGDLAVNWILGRARELTLLEKPEDHRVVQHRLAVALGTALAEPYGQVVAWAVDVGLSVSDEDARRLDRLAELRKHERMWEQERRMEVSMRRYLSEDVLSDTGSAVVWWLARHPDQIEESVRMIGSLAQLTAAANSKEIPAPELLRAIQAAEPNGRHIPGHPAA